MDYTSKLLTGQFPKFVVTGILNTAVDFLVLNVLITAFGVGTLGLRYPVFKTISFLMAVTNSYLLNKYWVFSDLAGKKPLSKESGLFLMVSLGGLVVNIAVAFLFFKIFLLFMPQSTTLASNIGALIGTILVLLYNFMGYKFIVFK